MSRPRGMSLAEVIIGTVVLGIFLTMIGQVLVLAYRKSDLSTRQTEPMQEAASAMDLLQRELWQCNGIYSPDPTGPALSPGVNFTAVKSAPFVFQFLRNGSTLVTSGWYVDGGYLEHFEEEGFVPGIGIVTLPAAYTRTLAGDVQTLVFQRYDPGSNSTAEVVQGTITVAIPPAGTAVFPVEVSLPVAGAGL